MSRPALFLDRDGVVNQPPPPGKRYVTRPEDFHLLPGIAKVIREANHMNLPVVVVTNQKCVATGLLDEATLAKIHLSMSALLAEQGARVDAVYHCPHREEDGCDCRKPLPGMLLRAARELRLDPSASWMVGDQPRDCEAGRAAGCRTLYIGEAPDTLCDLRLPSVAALAEHGLARLFGSEFFA